MGQAAIALFFCLLFAVKDTVRLKEKKYRRENAFFICTLTLGFVMLSLHFFDIPLPTPIEAIQAIYGPVYEMLFGWTLAIQK
ncbi:hypothetical protein [Paenibacillus soyae]|uniref:Uncharacterized protein n=1 Tax=Paenibacillus soyae TaxID=2969249 RepID=A0A9X2SBJ7_9BACL|nr:hypothetical protein [Paenibacillus soyae]MCR2807110.1 hypothetical protein [Paenibacillus soyae]